MTTSQLESDAAVQLPSPSQVVAGRTWSLDELSRQVEKTSAARGVRLQRLDLDLPAILAGFANLFTTRLPDPFDPDGDDVEHVVVAAAGDWTAARTDAFIAAMAPVRTGPGQPRFDIFSTTPIPAEVTFLFETAVAGVLEIMAWDAVTGQPLAGQDCMDLGAVGRGLIAQLYEVSMTPDDLQWLSVVNQLVVEELRWFGDDPRAKMPEAVEFVPSAALTLLGCVAGEAIRLNHLEELIWGDASDNQWPHLAQHGTASTFPVIDYTFRRYESGDACDIWDHYEAFFAVGRLAPPVSMEMTIDPLEFLPGWDPEAEQSLDDAVAEFRMMCRAANLEVDSHPLHAEASAELAGFLGAFRAIIGGSEYALFVSTGPWTEPLQHEFVRVYGHYSMSDWEIGATPVFVFFSGHPLPPLLDWCHVTGPPTAPMEGLARVETPSPRIPAEIAAVQAVAVWFVDVLERYSTIGLDLRGPAVLPGLEFYLREDVRRDVNMTPPQSVPRDFEPLALLVCIGLTAGESVRLQDPEGCRWVFGERGWPVMQRGPETLDWVEQARAIFRGEADEFQA